MVCDLVCQMLNPRSLSLPTTHPCTREGVSFAPEASAVDSSSLGIQAGYWLDFPVSVGEAPGTWRLLWALGPVDTQR